MSQNINSSLSGVPQKNVVMCYDHRDSTYKGLQVGHFTSGSNFITGSKIFSFGIVSSGVTLFDSQPCKVATFFNHDQPAYRIYHANSTGTYLDYIKMDSGNAGTRIEIKGIVDLNQLAYQKHGNSDTSLTGRVLLYL